MENKTLEEKQQEIVKKFRDDIIYWKVKPVGANKSIFDLKPVDLKIRLRDEGIVVTSVIAKRMESDLISAYNKKLDKSEISPEFQKYAISRLKSVLETLESDDRSFDTIETIMQDELSTLKQESSQHRAKTYRKIMLEFTDCYNEFITTNVTKTKTDNQGAINSSNSVKTG